MEEVLGEDQGKKKDALNAFLNNGKNTGDKAITPEDIYGSKPIADLFPDTTIMCKFVLTSVPIFRK